MDRSHKHHLIGLITIILIVFSMVSLACSFTNKLFVDTEATTEAIQRTDEAHAMLSTQQAIQQTQQAMEMQGTQIAVQATQDMINLQSTQVAQEATLQARQSQDSSSIGGGQYAFYVVNDSSESICYLYMSLSSISGWGNDLLGSGNTLNSNESFTLYAIPAGTYDLRAEDCDHNLIASDFNVLVPENDTWTLSDIPSNDYGSYVLNVTNNNDTTIYYMYISPSYSDTWGEDWLGSDIISSNATYTFYGLAAGNYDLKAEDSDHNIIAQYNDFNIPTYDTWTIYDD